MNINYNIKFPILEYSLFQGKNIKISSLSVNILIQKHQQNQCID